MRLEVIQKTKAAVSGAIQEFSPFDISRQVVGQFSLRPRDPWRRTVARLVSRAALCWQQPMVRRAVGVSIPVPHDFACIEDRFGSDASLAVLLRLTRRESVESVLIPGCYLGGEDIQFWLRRGVRRLAGIDVYSLQERWATIVPQLRCYYGADITFQQATIEKMPFPNGSFDLLATDTVLEHVRNLDAMVRESARVLRAEGWVWHCFGPLYYCFGGDHCMAAYGDTAGYDHLLLSEDEYQRRIWDQPFFDKHPDPNLPFWARQNQFSFATAIDYIEQFQKRFRLRFIVLKVSAKALEYRQNQPERWKRLIEAGAAEHDLLIKSVCVVAQTKEGGPDE